MFVFDKEVYRLYEAAREIGIHWSTLIRWADDKQIACIRTRGGHRRFTREALMRAASPNFA